MTAPLDLAAIEQQSAYSLGYLADQFIDREYLPPKVIAHFDEDVPALVQRVRDLEVAATIEIPCRMHRGTSHALTLREAAVVIVTMFGMAEDSYPGSHNADQDQCVSEILSAGKDSEGYYEHVESLLGPDAFDYPDVAR